MKEGRTLKIIKPCLLVPQHMVSVPKMSEVTTTTLSWLSRALNTSRQPLTPLLFQTLPTLKSYDQLLLPSALVSLVIYNIKKIAASWCDFPQLLSLT